MGKIGLLVGLLGLILMTSSVEEARASTAIYWSEDGGSGDELKTSLLASDGTALSGSINTIHEEAVIQKLEIDSDRDHIYWVGIADTYLQFNQTSAIRRSDIDGANVIDYIDHEVMLEIGQSAAQVADFALSRDRLYWAETFEHAIANAHGGLRSFGIPEATGYSLLYPATSYYEIPYQVAVTSSGSISFLTISSSGGCIASYPGSYNGCLVTGPGYGTPRAITVDNTNSQVYWADSSSIFRAGFDGSNVQSLISGIDFRYDLRLNEETGDLYWLEGDGLYRLGNGELTPSQLLSGSINSFALDFSAIPEPSTALLLGLGLVGLAVRRRG